MTFRIQSIFLLCCLIWLCCSSALYAQNRMLVWSDEFNDTQLDHSVWSFDFGGSNDNIQYYTDRRENAYIQNGMLCLAARKEPYQGYNYTSSLVKTRHARYWRYGRIEARIKLPATAGLVPAFWMLPEDGRYGWWPNSGEIDIMEFPTNQATTIYGTVHTKAYNWFTGSPPRGSSINISSATTAFHVYAVEWDADQIDFYVDNRKYYSFNNAQGAFDTWPFNQPFYIIMNVAVGGGWVGAPPAHAAFPAVMEIDYVRVYQDLDEVAIIGPDYLSFDAEVCSYWLPPIEEANYQWSVPGHADILLGQNTHQIDVDWNLFGGTINAEMQHDELEYTLEYPVQVSANYLRNSGFEKGVKYWRIAANYPAVADFFLDVNNPHEGETSLTVDIQDLGDNPWDIQLSQRDLHIQANQVYEAGFWARSNNSQASLSAAIIDANNYFLHSGQSFGLTEHWAPYLFQFTSQYSGDVLFNIDMGTTTGVYYLDDLHLSTPDLIQLNPLINPDFTQGQLGWQLVTHGFAHATGSIEDGQYLVSITSGGQNTWDVYLGQGDVSVEQGKHYVVVFDAISSTPRSLVAIVGKNAEPWTVYCGPQNISIGTTQQRYTYSFVMNHPTDTQARLGFDIGAAGGDILFDNISLSPAHAGQ